MSDLTREAGSRERKRVILPARVDALKEAS